MMSARNAPGVGDSFRAVKLAGAMARHPTLMDHPEDVEPSHSNLPWAGVVNVPKPSEVPLPKTEPSKAIRWREKTPTPLPILFERHVGPEL